MIVESKGKTHELPDEMMPELVTITNGAKLIGIAILEFWETLQGSVPEDLAKELTLMFFQNIQQQGAASGKTEL
jgi:hypothetical protein